MEESPQKTDESADIKPDEDLEDDDGADPEWSLLEEKAEDEDSGDDEEKDIPDSRNSVRWGL